MNGILHHILTVTVENKPGVLSRVDYERTRAVMIGQGLIESAPSYETFVEKGARSAP